MRNRFTQYILFFFISIALFSCTDKEYEEDGNNTDINQVPVIATLATELLPENLICTMYVFGKSVSDAEDGYMLKEVKILHNTEQNSLKFKNSELISNSYRFLFVATPFNAQEIGLLKSDGAALQIGDRWGNIMIQSFNPIISADNYQGVVDKTGNEILDGKTINCTLTRLVGQVIFDIYKVAKEGDLTISQDVNAPHFTVLDRVFKIEIEYSDMTKSAAYNNEEIVHQDIWDQSYLQVIEPQLYANNNFKADVSWLVENLTFSEEKQGSAHIKGIYCMPSNGNLKIRLKFYFYDTTPFCGLDESHSSSCFETKTIVLNLPKTGATPLSVIPNHYTLNTAKIRYDRIIDIGTNSSFEFDSSWNNDNN
ncbi:DUF5031 domain-containing protein [Dysgonomonas sp. Marseille-P4677]|uniref:DUF5031 domain-containing protein n=1 Tax=Dysgonomonas sp. Marseille-P4677 TaxID=2364790 RepID=UPI0019119193|nr:DUF5031 domain-containing protein [Dysgonomonas sp. Marseille-P4677]MBK5722257.1 DUF5031 domain-containing protein [Dysgonomonas sp. Marseille-P4677]